MKELKIEFSKEEAKVLYETLDEWVDFNLDYVEQGKVSDEDINRIRELRRKVAIALGWIDEDTPRLHEKPCFEEV